MTLEEYKQMIYEDIKISAQANVADITSEYLRYVTELLIDAEEIDGFEECYFEGIGPRNKRMQIDGYNFDTVDNSCNLFICDFENDHNLGTITNTDIDNLYGRMSAFIENSVSGYIIDNYEAAAPGFELSYNIKETLDKISKFRFFILTDKIISKRVKSLKKENILEKNVELNVWDISRSYELELSGMGKEEICINFDDFGTNGLKAVIGIQSEKENYSSYLTTIAGDVLAKIYLEYGARLLEGNVRSFLSTKSKVNKGIRNTIINHPEMFFAYNNGIAATASEMIYQTTDYGIFIKELKNLQIINGGQTTASIANAVISKEGNVSLISVPMKLSIVDGERAEQMIPEIALCANSQNKIDEADFASNHPFHIRMETFSRKILAPAVDGNQYQKGWFYERARGQYNQAQMKLTPGERRAFMLKWDKHQIIKKVDLAKYMNTFEGHPHIVSRGAQFSSKFFNDTLKKEWKKSDALYNEYYFKRMVALAILFKATENIVSNQDWYKEIKSYRANIVTYALATLFQEIRNMDGYELDLKKIWNTQKVYFELEEQLVVLTKEIYEYITRANRPVQNVTQWCKQELCWTHSQKEHWTITKPFLLSLVSNHSAIEEMEEARKDQKRNSEFNIITEIINKKSEYWQRMIEWGRLKKIMTDIEEDFIKIPANLETTGKLPSEKQAKKIMEIKKRMETEGFE